MAGQSHGGIPLGFSVDVAGGVRPATADPPARSPSRPEAFRPLAALHPRYRRKAPPPGHEGDGGGRDRAGASVASLPDRVVRQQSPPRLAATEGLLDEIRRHLLSHFGYYHRL